MPFKRDLGLHNIHLLEQPFKTQPQIENEDVTWSPQYNLPTTRTTKRRALSLEEVELDGWLLILHIVFKTFTIRFMHKFNMSFFYFISIFLDWRVGFEPILQLKRKNLRAVQNENHMRASTLVTGYEHNATVAANLIFATRTNERGEPSH